MRDRSVLFLKNRNFYPLMGYKEFNRHLATAGFTVQEFSRAMKMHKNSVTNYAAADSVPSHLGVIALLLAELRGTGVDPKTLVQKFEISRKRPRGDGKGKFGGDKQIILFKPEDQMRSSSSEAGSSHN